MTVDELAERLFDAEQPPRVIDCPYGSRPKFSDLWHSDRERYRKMAEAILDVRHGDRVR